MKQSVWQQKVNHEIQVELVYENERAYLKASQSVEYINNSPDTLHEIYLHLWPNAYRDNSTPYALQMGTMGKKDFLLPGAKKGNINVSNIKVNGQNAEMLNAETEIAKVVLAKPLLPNESLTMDMDFTVLVPPFYSRMGASATFVAATQWYPKPAVYDVNGWNTMPYLDQGEFYSEFGDYKVSITVPKDFLVASSGEIQTEQEKVYFDSLSDFYLGTYDKIDTLEHKVTTKGHTYTKVQIVRNKPAMPWTDKHTVVYTQQNVHDFAWFASSKFKVIGREIKLKSGKAVFTRFFSTQIPNDRDLDKIETSLIHYSDHVGDYGYNVCSVVIGPLEAGGGMEYPTITICASNDFSTVMHEIGHNWFYGVLGSNERQFPWMDESVNTFYENLYSITSKRGFEIDAVRMSSVNTGVALSFANSNIDKLLDLDYRRMGESQSGDLPAEEYNSMSYYSVVYGRNPHSFTYLREYLGDAVFRKAMSDYYQKWKFKHPLPKDMQTSFENSTKQNLNWFFEGMLHDFKGTNFSIVYIKQLTPNNFEVKIRNNSELKIPLQYGFVQQDGNMFIEKGFVAPFYNQDTVIQVRTIYGRLEDFRIDPYLLLPENKRVDNLVKLGKENKKIKPGSKLTVKMLSIIENQYKRELIVQPAVGTNLYSGWGFGVNMYNRVFPNKKFEFSLMPMYALKSQSIIGMAEVKFNFRVFGKPFYRISTGVNTSRFDYKPNGFANVYNKINPFVTFYFKTKGKAAQRFEKKLNIEAIGIFSDKTTYGIYNETLDTTYVLQFNPSTRARYLRIQYRFKDFHAVNPQSMNFGLEGGNTGIGYQANHVQFAKFDFSYSIEQVLNKKGRGMKAEFRTGAILYQSKGLSGIYLFRGSGNSGTFDYLFNDLMMGRNESIKNNIWGQQLITQGGDMRINAPSFIGNSYMTLKLESSLPLIKIVRVYGDFALNPSLFDKATLYWVGGISFVLLKDVAEIYMPLVYGQNFKDFYDLNKISFMQRISFKLNLDYVYFRKNLDKHKKVLGL
ncbi:MAG: M1 family metallopeptidase [Bacteroidia bacterium]|nr:M1 family metallopeptidase [Bacteroidia bacterium]MCO5254917.1 M1 family metallopeptidase [Bacteroidota bacterium]